MTKFRKSFLPAMLALALIFLLAGCGQNNQQQQPDGNTGVTLPVMNGTTVGEGKTSFTMEVKTEESTVIFTVQTDETTVGAALEKLGIIDGEQGDYGLYVKTVNSKYVDYATDGAYWAFYVNGEYATASVDQTDITPDSTYTFSVEAA